MGRGDSLALAGNPPRDGVSIKIPVVVAPKNHYPLLEGNVSSLAALRVRCLHQRLGAPLKTVMLSGLASRVKKVALNRK